MDVEETVLLKGSCTDEWKGYKVMKTALSIQPQMVDSSKQVCALV
jgi:hypothetical protein